VLIDTALAGSSPGAWQKNFGQLPGAFKHQHLLKNFTHGTLRAPKLFWHSEVFGWEPLLSLSLGGALGGPGQNLLGPYF